MSTDELHVFDNEFLGRSGVLDRHARRANDRIREATAAVEKRGARLDQTVISDSLSLADERLGLQVRPESYAPCFARQAQSRPGAQVVKEKTPTYAMLEASHWQISLERLLASDLNPHVVVSMRDPVKRVMSQYRMAQGSAWGESSIKTDADGALGWLLAPDHSKRANYRTTAESLTAVLPRDRFRLVLFESMFTDFEMRRMTDFLGIDYVDPEFEHISNQSTWQWECADVVRGQLREEFDDAYVFARAWFGEEPIQGLWKNA